MLFNGCIPVVPKLCLFHLTTFISLLLLSCPFFHLSLSQYLIFLTLLLIEYAHFVVLLRIYAIDFQMYFLFLALDDEKYVFAVLCLKTNSWLHCLFLLMATYPYKKNKSSKTYPLSSKGVESCSFLYSLI